MNSLPGNCFKLLQYKISKCISFTMKVTHFKRNRAFFIKLNHYKLISKQKYIYFQPHIYPSLITLTATTIVKYFHSLAHHFFLSDQSALKTSSYRNKLVQTFVVHLSLALVNQLSPFSASTLRAKLFIFTTLCTVHTSNPFFAVTRFSYFSKYIQLVTK